MVTVWLRDAEVSTVRSDAFLPMTRAPGFAAGGSIRAVVERVLLGAVEVDAPLRAVSCFCSAMICAWSPTLCCSSSPTRPASSKALVMTSNALSGTAAAFPSAGGATRTCTTIEAAFFWRALAPTRPPRRPLAPPIVCFPLMAQAAISAASNIWRSTSARFLSKRIFLSKRNRRPPILSVHRTPIHTHGRSPAVVRNRYCGPQVIIA
mmetsp:Transcript_21189/g.52731  ORF Transcript_21189/g.52731 Transcript_21189/m.52731 type:complete len:207 (-) Transcript_21189:76-696(-)